MQRDLFMYHLKFNYKIRLEFPFKLLYTIYPKISTTASYSCQYNFIDA